MTPVERAIDVTLPPAGLSPWGWDCSIYNTLAGRLTPLRDRVFVYFSDTFGGEEHLYLPDPPTRFPGGGHSPIGAVYGEPGKGFEVVGAIHVLATDEGAADRSERIVREVLKAAFASWPVVDDVFAEPTFAGACRDIARSLDPALEALGAMGACMKVRPYRPPYAKTLMEAVYGKGV